jgi:hypothetical protein
MSLRKKMEENRAPKSVKPEGWMGDRPIILYCANCGLELLPGEYAYQGCHGKIDKKGGFKATDKPVYACGACAL